MMQNEYWTYNKFTNHKSALEVLSIMAQAHAQNCNLLMNIGLLPSGKIVPEDYEALLEVGGIIDEIGFNCIQKYKDPIKKAETGAEAE